MIAGTARMTLCSVNLGGSCLTRGQPGRGDHAGRPARPSAAPDRPIVDAYAHAIHVVFLAAVPVPIVALVLALFLKQVPLRGTAREAASDVGEGFSMPEGSDADQQLS